MDQTHDYTTVMHAQEACKDASVPRKTTMQGSHPPCPPPRKVPAADYAVGIPMNTDPSKVSRGK